MKTSDFFLALLLALPRNNVTKVVLKWNHLFSSKSPLWSTFRP